MTTSKLASNVWTSNVWGSKDGAVVRALASHQRGPGSNPGVDAICGLSLLLVLSLAPRGFSPVSPVFPSPQKLTLPNSNSILNARTRSNEFIWTLKCFMGKKQFFLTYNMSAGKLPSKSGCRLYVHLASWELFFLSCWKWGTDKFFPAISKNA